MTHKEREKLIDQMVDIMDNHESFDGQSLNHNKYGSAEDIMKLFERLEMGIEDTDPCTKILSKEQYIENQALGNKLFGLL